jgi:hypothetical protein
MFCNRCGTEMPSEGAACPNCGRRIGDPVSAVAQSRLERHLHILGILWIATGALFLIPAVILIALGPAFLHFVMHGQEPPVEGLFPVMLVLLGMSLAILAAGGICVGVGLMQMRPWARISAIILGVLALLHPPFGTALGVYTLWVLLADENGNEYRYLARAG